MPYVIVSRWPDTEGRPRYVAKADRPQVYTTNLADAETYETRESARRHLLLHERVEEATVA